jgi:hypothetical protein
MTGPGGHWPGGIPEGGRDGEGVEGGEGGAAAEVSQLGPVRGGAADADGPGADAAGVPDAGGCYCAAFGFLAGCPFGVCHFRALVEPAGPVSVTCPRCGRTSHHPDDAREGFCGACRDWTSPPADVGRVTCYCRWRGCFAGCPCICHLWSGVERLRGSGQGNGVAGDRGPGESV